MMNETVYLFALSLPVLLVRLVADSARPAATTPSAPRPS